METNASIEQLGDVAVFVHVVRAGGFSAAARALGLTKSAVSKRIGRLEKQCGLRLLQRTTRAMALTEAGRLLHAQAAPGVALLDESLRLTAGLAETPRGLLRVTAPATFAKLCLTPLLPAFLAAHPDIELQLTLLDRPVDLIEEGYDVAIRLTRSPPGQAVAKKLLPIRYRLASTVDYLKTRKIETPTDLAAHNCLHYGLPEFAEAWRFQRDGEEVRVPVHGNVAVNNSEVLRELLLAGIGIGLIWDRAIADDLAAGRLAPLLPEWTPSAGSAQTAWALWLPQPHLPPKVRVFVDHLAAHLAEGKTTP